MPLLTRRSDAAVLNEILLAEAHPGLDLLALHRRQPQRYPFLLQSLAGEAADSARYDLLLAFPQAAIQVAAADTSSSRFFAQLDTAYARESAPRAALLGQAPAAALPFLGGWFLYLGYEAARLIEPRLSLPPAPYTLPDALAVRCSAAVVVDRLLQRTWLLAERDPAELAALQDDCAAVQRQPAAEAETALGAVCVEEAPPALFTDGVQRILEYLRAGDVFQVNLSRAWRAHFAAAPAAADLYARLRRSNPAPFAGLVRWGDTAIISSSPERLAAVQGAEIETRPIAGTCARLADVQADAAARAHFVANLKERAEHVMLIDLERNDLGRVCVPGSIAVDTLMHVETYTHVHHLVSRVHGRLREAASPGAVLRAVFPGGTITGCPKVRSMEIIAELEGEGRGPYTGAMGYLSRCGRMDTNILIRTMVACGSTVHWRAGAGIVTDSHPQRELEETRHKARGLLRAIDAGAA